MSDPEIVVFDYSEWEDYHGDPFAHYSEFGVNDGSAPMAIEEPPSDFEDTIVGDDGEDILGKYGLDLEDGIFFLDLATARIKIRNNYQNRKLSNTQENKIIDSYLQLGGAVCVARDLLEETMSDLILPWLRARGSELMAFNFVVGRALEEMDMYSWQKELLSQYQSGHLAFWLHKLLLSQQ